MKNYEPVPVRVGLNQQAIGNEDGLGIFKQLSELLTLELQETKFERKFEHQGIKLISQQAVLELHAEQNSLVRHAELDEWAVIDRDIDRDRTARHHAVHGGNIKLDVVTIDREDWSIQRT